MITILVRSEEKRREDLDHLWQFLYKKRRGERRLIYQPPAYMIGYKDMRKSEYKHFDLATENSYKKIDVQKFWKKRIYEDLYLLGKNLYEKLEKRKGRQKFVSHFSKKP